MDDFYIIDEDGEEQICPLVLAASNLRRYAGEPIKHIDTLLYKLDDLNDDIYHLRGCEKLIDEMKDILDKIKSEFEEEWGRS